MSFMPSSPPGPSVPENQPHPQEAHPFDAQPFDDQNAEHAITPEGELSGTYARLAQPFDIVFHDNRGGVPLTYISGEQSASRLNEVLGPGAWSFTVIREGHEEEADTYWCLGHLEAWIDGRVCVREQYGAAKVKRPRPKCAYMYDDSTVRMGEVCGEQAYDHHKRHQDHAFVEGPREAPINIGYDKKSSATDAFKKCASLIGVGLYLSARVQTPDGKGVSAAVAGGNARGRQGSGGQQTISRPPANSRQSSSSLPRVTNPAAPRGATPPATTTLGATGPTTSTPNGASSAPPVMCQECGNPLREQNFSNGHWSVDTLRKNSRDLFDGREYCYPCFKVHNAERQTKASA